MNTFDNETCLDILFFNTQPEFNMLGGQKFASDMEVQLPVQQWLGQQPASFFAEGITEACLLM